MKLKITGQEIEVVDKYLLVTETENLYEIGFEFDESWEGYAKTVVFKDATTIYSVLLTGETCPIPNEIIAESGNVQFGVFGTKVDGTKTLKKPTIWSEKLYVDVGCVTGDTPGEPTPSIYAQIVALAEAAAESAEDSAESAEASATSALNAQQAAEIAQATVSHTPYIDSTNYHWKRWNATTQAYEDTGVDARGLNNITTSTDTDLNGILKGNGSKVGVAVGGTDYVVPVDGKGLSTNDYDNTEKQKVADSYQAKHSHSNKELLDTYNQTNANITDAIGKKHEHANKSTLDGISGTDISNWNQVTAKYEKPESGIPKSDLASSVQTSLGKADTALQEHQSLADYRTRAAQDVIDATFQTSNDNSLSTDDKTVVGAINEVNNVAKGAVKAYAVANYQTMVDALNAAARTLYKVGQNIYVQTLNVPDVWIYSVESTSVPYTYTTDEALANALELGAVQIGYYKISKLETSKVDLSNYYTKTQTDSAISNHHDSTKVDVVEGKGLSENDYSSVEKQKVADSYSAKHTHENKDILDAIIQSVVDGWNSAVTWITTNGANVVSHLTNSTIHTDETEKATWNGKSVVSVSASGTATDEVEYITINGTEKKIKSGDEAIWGNITGTLSNQTDLQTALDSKQNETDLSLNTTSKQIVGAINEVKETADSKSVVSVNASGSATDEVEYITIDGVEKKLKAGTTIQTLTTAEVDTIWEAN